MTRITIHLEPGPDGQPVGQLTTGTGHAVAFTGWLHLIRLLEDQLRQAPPEPGAGPFADPLAVSKDLVTKLEDQ